VALFQVKTAGKAWQAKPAAMFGYLLIENLSFLFPMRLLYLSRHGRAPWAGRQGLQQYLA
jgi:hypothetical protein